MRSSSQINEQDYKDSYVNALIQREAMDASPDLSMPTQTLGEIAGAFEDRLVEPTSSNPYGFPEEVRGSDDFPKDFGSWDADKQGAFLSLPHIDI